VTHSAHANNWMASSVEGAYSKLSDDTTTHFADLCPAISKPLIHTLVDRLPASPALTLSVGCGSGLLEALTLHAGEHVCHKTLDIRGVEVSDCTITHLPNRRVYHVSSTTSVHDDALLASSFLFVYPRQAELVARYLDASLDGALEQLVWLGHRNDWPELEMLLLAAFFKLERIDGPGVADYELLVIASMPRRRRKQRD
jgi:hypothetical protein